MTKIKMRFSVDIEITNDEPWKMMEAVKDNLRRASMLDGCKVKDVRTDAMLSEEICQDREWSATIIDKA